MGGDGIEELKPFLMDLCSFCNQNWHTWQCCCCAFFWPSFL